MTNPAYPTNFVSLGNCPAQTYNTGFHDRIPGDSILGLFGSDYSRFMDQTYYNPCSTQNIKPLTCNKLADLYYGPHHLREHRPPPASYGLYRGDEHVDRPHR